MNLSTKKIMEKTNLTGETRTRRMNMNTAERITCVDVGEACGHLISFIEEMRRKGRITGDAANRYRGDVKLLTRQAAENPTAPLMLSDL